MFYNKIRKMSDFYDHLNALYTQDHGQFLCGEAFLEASVKVKVENEEEKPKEQNQMQEEEVLNGVEQLEEFLYKTKISKGIQKEDTKDDNERGLDLDSLITRLQDDEIFVNKLLDSRYTMQIVQAKQLSDIYKNNEKNLKDMQEEAMKSYNVDLNDSKSREELPDESKTRLSGMFVNRTDLKTRIANIRKNLIEDMFNFMLWMKDGKREFKYDMTEMKGSYKKIVETLKPKIEKMESELKQAEEKMKKMVEKNQQIFSNYDDEIRNQLDMKKYIEKVAEGISSYTSNDEEAQEQFEKSRRKKVSRSQQSNNLKEMNESIEKYKKLHSELETLKKKKEGAQKKLDEILYENTNDKREAGRKNYVNLVIKYLMKIDSFVGMKELKQRVANDVATLIFSPLRYGSEHFNIALLGHAGTGKTQVAQLIGPLYKIIGIVPRGGDLDEFQSVSPNDLMSSFQAATAVRTAGIIMRYAFGGVLFIDEVYGFGEQATKSSGTESGGGTGTEAITQIVKSLDEFKGLVLVIVAGYEDKVQRLFFDLNSGLPSRFPARYVLPDYTASELYEIFEKSLETSFEWQPQTKNVSTRANGIEEQQKKVAGDISSFLEVNESFVIKEGVPTAESTGFEIHDAAKRTLELALRAMKAYDNYLISESARSNEIVADKIALKRKQLMQSMYQLDFDENQKEFKETLQSLTRLMEAGEIIGKTSQISNDPVGLFRGTNARGIKQIYGLCVSAWAVRQFVNNQNTGFGTVSIAQIEKKDVIDAIYKYTKSMLGVGIQFERNNEKNTESQQTVSKKRGAEENTKSQPARRSKRLRVTSLVNQFNAMNNNREYTLQHLAEDMDAIFYDCE